MLSGLRHGRVSAWALVVFAVAIVAVLGALIFRPSVDGADQSFTPPPDATAVPTPTDFAEPVLAIYGDSYTYGNELGGEGWDGWAYILRDELGARAGIYATRGSGYVTKSPTTGQRFLELIEDHPVLNADVVIIYGSRNDGGSELPDLPGTAQRTLERLRELHPTAQLIVVGMPWTSADVPDRVKTNRDMVRAAAEKVGATFVDPLTEGWFFDRPDLISSDGVHPTDEGHEYMAERMRPHVAAALTAAGF